MQLRDLSFGKNRGGLNKPGCNVSKITNSFAKRIQVSGFANKRLYLSLLLKNIGSESG